tara:strand:- start:358 stop:528 length:171 start_codon:yes stop_codon:yes gene_type:complete
VRHTNNQTQHIVHDGQLGRRQDGAAEAFEAALKVFGALVGFFAAALMTIASWREAL